MDRIAKPTFGDRYLYKCGNCGLVRMHPLPVDEADIDSIYQSEDYLGGIDQDEYRGYFTFFLGHLTEKLGIGKDARVLDFGAGKCFYQKFFLETGFSDVHSLEINRKFVTFARGTLGLDNVHLDAAALEPRSFDLVISNQVFEHLIDPIEILQTSILPLVKPGGRVVFAVPNWASWNRPILGKRWVGYSPEDHIWFFSPDSARFIFSHVKDVEIEDITIGSSIDKPYSRYSPKGFVKKFYLKTVWVPIEAIGKGDQLVVTLRKTG